MTNEADKPGVRGFFKRLRAKLNTGPAWLTTDIKELLPGRKIDAEILDDLEARLISADVGVEAAVKYLKSSPALLVEEYGRIVGIVTRQDVLDVQQ